MKRILSIVCALLALFVCQVNLAKSGLLFNVSATGSPDNVNITLCLNGYGPLSCQHYDVAALNLKIRTTTPNHVYPSAGIYINTPGYTIANLGIDCKMISNGYCLFSGSDIKLASISINNMNAFSIGGTVSGLTGTLILQNNGTNAITIASDGYFTFSKLVNKGNPYVITVQTQPAGQTCTVAQGSGVMGSANVTNVTVTCSVNHYTVGGTVSGLSGTVTLQNNGVNSTPISSNGSFTFSTSVAEGSVYDVTVQTQPSGQTCSVSNGSGTMGSANVTNVVVTCSTNAYTVGGTVTGLNGTVTLQNNGANSTPISTNSPFTFSTPIAEGSPYNVTVQTQPTEQTCTVTNGSGTMGSSNVTNVGVSCSNNNTTLSVSSTGIIPVNGSSGTITVTNTGATYTAYNVSATLPGAWTGVTQDSTNCSAIAPNATCVLSFTSTTPYVAQANITVTGDNITSPPTTALGFSLNNYLVWAISGNTALVLASSDASSSQDWSATNDGIAGITETSIAPPCNGATDGACNTGQIVTYYGTPYTSYAAGLCYGITSDNTGAVSVGTWYLPAICQLGGSGGNANCSSGLANIDTNLVQLGFSGLSGFYWSATEYSGNPALVSWLQYLASSGGSVQYSQNKTATENVRCVRAINY